jgi:salicylate hydroxylase
MMDVRINESKKQKRTDPRINSSLPTKHIDWLDYHHHKPPQTSGCATMNLHKIGLLYLSFSFFCVEGLSAQPSRNANNPNHDGHPASRILKRHLEDSPFNFDQQPQPKSLAAQQACGTVVVGGGIAGLATAIALRTIAGVQDVRIWEQSPQRDFTNSRSGAAAQLGPNGLRAFKLLSNEQTVQQLRDLGTEVEGNAIMMMGKDNTPEVLAIPDTTMQETGYPQVLVRWGILRSVLTNLLPSDIVSNNMGGDISGYTCATSTEGNSSILVQPVDPSGQVITDSNANSSIPLLVGADGAHSIFRSLVKHSRQQQECALNQANSNDILMSEKDLHTAKRADMKYGGRVNIKAVVEHTLPAEFHQGHTYSYFAPGGGVACFAGPTGKGFTYWAISIADTMDAVTGETKSFLDKSDTKDPKVIQQRVLEQLNSLQAKEIDFVLELIRKTDPAYLLVQPSEEAQGLENSLHSSDHRLVLVGDAAHAMSPAYGQAANFALEDAVTLAVCIRDHDSLDEAIEHYSQLRVQRCLEMQRKSAERSAKSMKGEAAEDVSKWIFEWDIQ